ncbi:protein phosphatase 2C domain-containing protein [Streptomyces griseosporeus]|uniref:protein phosphatase 2C domain-containing protein n=1 Tax=Streptomyces griseosporeus TaxID=1910 RepID=UPI0036FB700F
MSQQGGRPAGPEDDWWAQLYDDATEDTGPTAAPDSLDDRFVSATGTLGTPAAPEALPPQRTGPPPGPDDGTGSGAAGTVRPRAPWEPPPSAPPEPASFPPGPMPPGFAQRGPEGRTAPPEPPETAPAPDSGAQSPPTSTTQGTAPGLAAPADPPASPPAPAPAPPLPEAPPVPPAPPFPDAPPPSPPAPAPVGTASDTDTPAAPEPPAPRTPTRVDLPAQPPAPLRFVGTRPPTYDAEPTALPAADPDDLGDLVADTVLDGARYGVCTLRAASVRGDSARYRGEPRRDALLTARFGAGEQALVLVAMATGARATPGAHRAAAEACRWIGRAVGRSHARLVEDIRAARRGDLKSGLHRLTDRSLGRLRAGAAEQGLKPEEYSATLRCLLLPADPACRVRVFFGVGAGGLFRLRDDAWRDIEPPVGEVAGEPVVGFGSPPAETPEGDRLTMDLGIPTPPSPYEPAPQPPREPFRFRASVARPGDVLLMCTEGLAEPLRGEPELCRHLTGRWSEPAPPGLAAFLADTQVRVKGYADDRTAAAVWEA